MKFYGVVGLPWLHLSVRYYICTLHFYLFLFVFLIILISFFFIYFRFPLQALPHLRKQILQIYRIRKVGNNLFLFATNCRGFYLTHYEIEYTIRDILKSNFRIFLKGVLL